MNRILLKVAMLLMFILAVLGIWTAMAMTFPADIWNFLLGVVGVFFFFRGLELVDKINKLGSYAEEQDEKGHMPKGPGEDKHAFGDSKPEDEPDITGLPDEE